MRIGLVCMMKGKGMKKGFAGIKAIEKAPSVEVYKKLEEASLFNIEYSLNCLKWVKDYGKNLFRISSSLIPYSDFFNWKSSEKINKKLIEFRDFAKINKIRLVMHPDQFTVLNSEKESVIENSISILNHHNDLAEILGVRDLIIHTGSGKGNFIERFVETANKLPQNIKDKLLIENCHSVSIETVLEICEKSNLRPCLDLHHDRIKPSTKPVENYIEKVVELSRGRTPLGHLSSPLGKEKLEFKKHSDYISKEDLEKFKDYFDILDIEIEAKAKEKAVREVVLYFETR